MKRIYFLRSFFFITVLIALTTCTSDQELYSRSFGDAGNPAIVFLHGGPGYNSASFEISTAESLARKGFYVIVYDNRGSGRSEDVNGTFTFEEVVQDLHDIYKKYGIDKATLLGHSFGGAVGIKFALKHPGKVKHLILVDAPVNYPHTFKTIIDRCEIYYKEKKMPDLLYIAMLRQMDTASLDYATYSFMHAMSCGLYQPPQPTAEAKVISGKMRSVPEAKYLKMMTEEPVKGFYNSEHYTTIDLTPELKKVAAANPVFAICGEDDGLFDEEHFQMIADIVGESRFFLLKNASHSVFIDQQAEFLQIVESIVKDPARPDTLMSK